ncbi:MAG: hypothetical protein JOZ70_14430 [Pseudolabrys sp.]|nr:hypothetical protein [Pseudolabrys sp.]
MQIRSLLAACAALTILAGPLLVAPAAAEENEAMSQARRLKEKREKETDDAYRRSLNNIDNKDVRQDPWGNIRSAEQPATTGTKKK